MSEHVVTIGGCRVDPSVVDVAKHGSRGSSVG